MEKIFFDSWENILRIMIMGVCSYAGLVFMLRTTGSRTLSQLNAFDFIVTVALGSTLATVILNNNVPLVDGLFALALLIILQLVVSKLSVHYKGFRKLVKTEPFLLFFRGEFLFESLKTNRITEDELLQIARAEGVATLEEVEAIVLETNGQFSVLKKLNVKDKSTLENVAGFEGK